MIAAGEAPDMTILTNTDMFELMETKLNYPLTDFIKKNNIDLSRFQEEAIDSVKMSSGLDELIGLPYTLHFSALYYNKDIFDKFAVPYPKDGMTWEDARELAKKVTRNEGGVQYRGLEFNMVTRQIDQLSVPYVDPVTFKAIFNNDKVKRVFEMDKSIYDIPGNNQSIWNNEANELFTKSRTLAMLAANNILFHAGLDKLTDFNWDMVSYPTFPELPGVGLRVDAHVLSVTSASKHKEDALKVLATVISDDVQLEIARNGRLSVLKDKKFKDAFGQNLDFIKGKNIQAAFLTRPAKSIIATPYLSDAQSAVRAAFKEVTEQGKDINTALREAEEKTNKKIEEKLMASGKK
jgi:multiple sugar transport system substrate-binding protein